MIARYEKNPNTPIVLSPADVRAIRAGDEKRISEIIDAEERRRFASLETARRDGVALPPIWVIPIAEGWGLRDGLHRLCLARRHGDTQILAVDVTGDGPPFMLPLSALAHISAAFERYFQ